MKFLVTERNFFSKLPLFWTLLSRLTPAVSGEIFGWKYWLPRSKIFYPTLPMTEIFFLWQVISYCDKKGSGDRNFLPVTINFLKRQEISSSGTKVLPHNFFLRKEHYSGGRNFLHVLFKVSTWESQNSKVQWVLKKKTIRKYFLSSVCSSYNS